MKIFKISTTKSYKIKIIGMLKKRRVMIIEIKRMNKSMKIFQRYREKAKYYKKNQRFNLILINRIILIKTLV